MGMNKKLKSAIGIILTLFYLGINLKCNTLIDFSLICKLSQDILAGPPDNLSGNSNYKTPIISEISTLASGTSNLTYQQSQSLKIGS